MIGGDMGEERASKDRTKDIGGGFCGESRLTAYLHSVSIHVTG